MDPQCFLLVHSPIVGPDTWQPVAEELRSRGHEAVVPVLADDGSPPFWHQHTRAVVAGLSGRPRSRGPVTAVAHSAAGQLMAQVGVALREDGHAIEAYVLADAGVPTGGWSRLEQLRRDEPRVAEELEALFETGDRFPNWSAELLSGLVPDPLRRRKLVSGIRQLPLEFWEEPIAPVLSWPDAPCGVLILSGGYETTVEIARSHGWPVRRLDVANHFLMLVEPDAVARELIGIRERLMTRGQASG